MNNGNVNIITEIAVHVRMKHRRLVSMSRVLEKGCVGWLLAMESDGEWKQHFLVGK